jgi:hypothetical protein
VKLIRPHLCLLDNGHGASKTWESNGVADCAASIRQFPSWPCGASLDPMQAESFQVEFATHTSTAPPPFPEHYCSFEQNSTRRPVRNRATRCRLTADTPRFQLSAFSVSASPELSVEPSSLGSTLFQQAQSLRASCSFRLIFGIREPCDASPQRLANPLSPRTYRR